MENSFVYLVLYFYEHNTFAIYDVDKLSISYYV